MHKEPLQSDEDCAKEDEAVKAGEDSARPARKNWPRIIAVTFCVRVFQIFLGLVVAASAAVFAIGWALSSGPVSLPKLTPYLSDIISDNPQGVRVDIGDTVVSWAGWERNFDLKITDVQAYSSSNKLLAIVPEVFLSLSGPALVDGVIAPRRVELSQPSFNLKRFADGHFEVDLGGEESLPTFRRGNSASDPIQMLERLLSGAPDHERPLTYLEQVVLQDAVVAYTDLNLGLDVEAPRVSLEMVREDDRLLIDVDADVQSRGERVSIVFTGAYGLATGEIDGGLEFSAVRPSVFSDLFSDVPLVAGVDLPLQGEAALSAHRTGEIDSALVRLQSSGGRLELPDPADQVLAVEEFALQAGFEGDRSLVSVQQMDIVLAPETSVLVPEPLSHSFPIEIISLNGTFSLPEGILNIDQLAIDSGANALVEANAQVVGLGIKDVPDVTLEGRLANVAVDDIALFWPSALGTPAWTWVTERLGQGTLEEATISMRGTGGDDGAFVLDSLSGTMSAADVRVDYLPPMPPVDRVTADIQFDDKQFVIQTSSGTAEGLSISRADILIRGLDVGREVMDIDLDVAGSVSDALGLINSEPLQYPAKLGINPETAGGEAAVNVKLSFPLLADLAVEEVDVSATADLVDTRLEDVALGHDLSGGNLTLAVTQSGMEINGQIILGDLPASLSWRENFVESTDFRSRYLLSGTANATQRQDILKLDFPPFVDPYMEGDVIADVEVVKYWDDTGVLNSAIDLTEARMSLPFLRWLKPAGQPASARAVLSLVDWGLDEVSFFDVQGPDLAVSGRVALTEGGQQLEALELDQFANGRTDLNQVTLIPREDGGWEADLAGESVDLTHVLEDLDSTETGTEDDGKVEVAGTFSGRFNEVWLDEDRKLTNVVAAMTSDGEVWQRAQVSGRAGGDAPFELSLEPKDMNRVLTITSDDAGQFLTTLDVFDRMVGGTFNLTATYNDDVENRPLVGRVRIEDYRILELPVMAQVLNVAALTGIVDALQGDGVGFLVLDAPFKYDGSTIELKDVRANGSALGFTASGMLFTGVEVLDLEGTIIPAYALNSALGYIPLLGDLLTGGEEGGGIFAFNYTVKGPVQEPDVVVNPLSALAPGFLRRLFGADDALEPSNLPNRDE